MLIPGLSLGGCSIVALKTVPNDHVRGQPVDCSSGYAIPGVDAAIAVLTGVLAVSMHSAASSERDTGGNNAAKTVAWTATGTSILFMGLATYGAIRRRECATAQDASKGDPTVYDDGTTPGRLGGRCLLGDRCAQGLVCDTPMNTCVGPSSDDL